jgi:hypothetical protein
MAFAVFFPLRHIISIGEIQSRLTISQPPRGATLVNHLGFNRSRLTESSRYSALRSKAWGILRASYACIGFRARETRLRW